MTDDSRSGAPTRPARLGPRLSALMVNYESGSLADACARSLRLAWGDAGYAPELLELVVVDNASKTDQTEPLARLAAAGARVIRSTENLGYAGGIQRAFETTDGEAGDFVAILNPDVVFLPGSVATLVRHLARDPRCGAVAPSAFLDEGEVFHLPAVALPGALEEACSALEPRLRHLARARAAARTRRARAALGATEPVPAAMLSGACLFLPRVVAESLDTLLDPDYPLYYEDADLCRRLARRGLGLDWHPGARILHHWSRSAGAGADFQGEPMLRHAIARRRYLDRYASRVGRALVRRAEGWAGRRAGRPSAREPRPMHTARDLGSASQPPRLDLAGAGRVLLELTMSPCWSLAVRTVATAGPWRFPAPAWSWLFPGRYFLRAVDAGSNKLRGAWTFVKETPARTEPVDVDALYSRAPHPRPEGRLVVASNMPVGWNVPLERPAAPPPGPVVVFAPHPDDEVIGCGGTLALHADQGDDVHVIVVFDGAAGDPTGALDRRALVRRRRAEALAGGRTLTGTPRGLSYEFWDLAEGHVPTVAELDAAARRMADCIREKGAATVYAPWSGDGHVDHRSVARALELALERAPDWSGTAWGFEVWTPLVPARVLDVGRTIVRKQAALACHVTQSTAGDLAHRALGLGAYRSQLLGPGALYGEAFCRVRAAFGEESAA